MSAIRTAAAGRGKKVYAFSNFGIKEQWALLNHAPAIDLFPTPLMIFLQASLKYVLSIALK